MKTIDKVEIEELMSKKGAVELTIIAGTLTLVLLFVFNGVFGGSL
jgi:hypothetical protein